MPRILVGDHNHCVYKSINSIIARGFVKLLYCCRLVIGY